MKDLNAAIDDTQKATDEMAEIFDFIVERFTKASSRGRTEAFLQGLSYISGSLIPLEIDERSYGQMHLKMIEAMGTGIQAGMQVVGAKGSMEMIVRKI